ncbi:MAG: murein biosynthesis integral membrane protein MurJ [Firmicutes bacterium]|nr:murein biosynthesis integral membrane protein MurJ [Bacillota bacterium]
MQARRKAPRKSLGLSASLVFIATLVSRMSGFAREIVMAAFFGTRMFTDAWLMASALPNLLFSTINGAISVTVVPLMTAADAEYSPRSIARFLNEVFTVLFLASVALTILGEIFTPLIIHIMAPGFDHHPQELRLTINMTRIMIPTIFFWGVAGLAAGILQAREEYFTPAVSPVAINLVRVVTIIVLGHYLFGIQGVAIGFSIAVISQLMVLLPRLQAMHIHLHFRWHFSHPLLKQMARMAGPFFLTSSVGSIGILVDRILASELAVGSIAALNYSYVLVQIPVGLLVSSLAMPIYTRLSQHNSFRELETFRELAMQGFRLVLAIIVPITIWFIALRIPILRLLYQHGVFNGRSTALTAGTLLYFSVGLPGFGLSYYLQRLFFASRDTKSPARFSIITIITNIVGDLILVHFMQADGLALATGLASWVNATLLARKALKPRYQRNLEWARTFITLGISGLMTLAVTLAMRHVFHLSTLSGVIPLFFALALTAVVSGSLYIAFLSFLKFPEVDVLMSRLTRGRYLPRQ